MGKAPALPGFDKAGWEGICKVYSYVHSLQPPVYVLLQQASHGPKVEQDWTWSNTCSMDIWEQKKESDLPDNLKSKHPTKVRKREVPPHQNCLPIRISRLLADSLPSGLPGWLLHVKGQKGNPISWPWSLPVPGSHLTSACDERRYPVKVELNVSMICFPVGMCVLAPQAPGSSRILFSHGWLPCHSSVWWPA